MSFLGEALEVLFLRYGGSLEGITLVLPDQNALPAFRKAAERFAQSRNQGFVLPSLTTMHAFSMELAGARVPRRLTLMVALYEAMREVDGSKFNKPFEKAKPLLEILLADFDEMDSQLVEPSELFKSLVEETEIKLRFADYITAEEVEIISSYWRHFSTERLERHDRSQMDLYGKLPALYQAFKDRLSSRGYLYRGAMYKEAYARLKEGQALVADQIVFLGFNKLAESQVAIIGHILQQQQGMLIWDTLPTERSTEESLYFQSRYRRYKTLQGPVVVHIDGQSQPTRHSMTQGAGVLLGAQAFAHEVVKLHKMEPTASVAVIARDGQQAAMMEDILDMAGIPVENLHMQSMAASPLYHLLNEVFTLHQRILGLREDAAHIPYAWVAPVLKHPIIIQLFKAGVAGLERHVLDDRLVLVDRRRLSALPLFDRICRPDRGPVAFWKGVILVMLRPAKAFAEAWVEPMQYVLFAVTALEDQLENIELRDEWSFWSMLSGELAVTYLPIMERQGGLTLATLSDLQGQDFDHLFFLDASEGSLPAALPRNSLFPLPIRRAYGMTVPKEDAAQQAYLFKRLLKRAVSAHYFVNQSATDTTHAEPSRYLKQLAEIGSQQIEAHTLALHAQAHPSEPIAIEKTPGVMRKLAAFFQLKENGESPRRLYPTQLGSYIKCPLLFYLTTLTHLREQDVVTEEMDGGRFGDILHQSMEALFKPVFEQNILVTPSQIEELEATREVTVRAMLMKSYGFSRSEHLDALGYVAVSGEVIADIVERLLERDRQRAPFQIAKLESPLKTPYEVTLHLDGGPIVLTLDGKFDRADRMADGTVEIVDFKTGGSVQQQVPNWDALFGINTRDDYKEAFQIILYAFLLHKAEGEDRVRPTVVRIADLFDNNTGNENHLFEVNRVVIDSIAPFSEEIESRLNRLLTEIFDPALPFIQTTDEKACKYCSFAGLCHRA